MKAATRLDHIQEYYFSRKLKEVAALIQKGKPVINMGIGSPDLEPPKAVIAALQAGLQHPQAHQYQSSIGIPKLREAIAQFYQNHYQVRLNPNGEVLPLMGSKEGIMHISMAFLNAGNEVLIPNPGYPTYTSVTHLVEAVPRYYELTEGSNWLPNIAQLAKTDLSRVKLMWLNYPHMPTGALATKEFYEEVIAFAKTNNIILVNDNPYSFIGSHKPQSLLSVGQAKEVALELNSLSKSFNVAGWRAGMLLGNKHLISQVLKVKSNMDSGMFYGIQQGAIAALALSDDWFKNLNAQYSKRKKLLHQLVSVLGCSVVKSDAGLFIWAKLPDGKKAEPFIDDLLHKKHLFITPGTIFGTNGEGYIRLSLCVTEEKIEEALNRF